MINWRHSCGASFILCKVALHNGVSVAPVLRRSVLRKLAFGGVTLVLASAGFLFAATDTFKDPLDTPVSKLARKITATQMSAVTHAGDRLVAVGIRGLIVFSDDAGKTWTQASVPVSSDLLDVNFPTDKDGWAVGHDGIVLHSRDSGSTWVKQLDGRMTQKLLVDHFESRVAAGQPDAERFLQDTRLNYPNGPEQSLLSVWFKDAQHGFVCGSFGTLLATNDGGATWESWIEKVTTDIPLHYYSIRGTKSGVFMTSERGIIFQLDKNKERFIENKTDYSGTFFNILDTGDAVIALGLRGTAYRRQASSVTKWEKIETGVASAFSGSALLPNGGALLVTQSGQLLTTRDNGNNFKMIPVAQPMLFTGVAAAGADQAVVVGSDGIRSVPLQ